MTATSLDPSMPDVRLWLVLTLACTMLLEVVLSRLAGRLLPFGTVLMFAGYSALIVGFVLVLPWVALGALLVCMAVLVWLCRDALRAGHDIETVEQAPLPGERAR